MSVAPTLRIAPDGPTVPLPAGERVLDALDEVPGAGLPSACRAGNCGLCVVAVLAGGERLDPPDHHEAETLRGLGAGPDQRLGCQLRAARTSPSRADVVLRVIRR